MKTAYIPQNDQVFGALTVREAITFSSKLQNFDQATRAQHAGQSAPLDGQKEEEVATCGDSSDGSDPNDDLGGSEPLIDDDFHSNLATKIMKQLGLGVCSDTRIGMCSGGQQKRVSIAMELVSRPSILVIIICYLISFINTTNTTTN